LGAFYIFINAFSAFFLVFSLIFLVLFKRWGKHEFARIEKKKKELEELLDSADQMIDEMNNFSDYVITNLEEKSFSVEKMVVSLEEKIKHNKEYIENIRTQEKETKEEKSGMAKTIIPFQSRIPSTGGIKKSITESKACSFEDQSFKPRKDSSKSMQILQMAENGFDETEIARKLNVGRGEIQLVLGMSKGIREA